MVTNHNKNFKKYVFGNKLTKKKLLVGPKSTPTMAFYSQTFLQDFEPFFVNVRKKSNL